MLEYEKIACMAVDDEPPALNVLRKHIEAVPTLALVATCHSAVEALDKLQHHQIDLLFLDIQMPQLLGTDFIRTLKSPPRVIFTTAYRKFAIEGFDLNAVDYLLKPISFERFLKAVSKAMDITLHAPFNGDATVPIENRKNYDKGHLYFRVDRKMVKVILDEILYIESLKDYVKIVMPSKTVITRQSISALEEMLPRDSFIRIHRSFIVATNKIESYSHEVIVIAKKELPISRMYKHEVSRKGLV
jgi:DNA-binding LytR/AlgR family response regulator